MKYIKSIFESLNNVQIRQVFRDNSVELINPSGKEVMVHFEEDSAYSDWIDDYTREVSVIGEDGTYTYYASAVKIGDDLELVLDDLEVELTEDIERRNKEAHEKKIREYLKRQKDAFDVYSKLAKKNNTSTSIAIKTEMLNRVSQNSYAYQANIQGVDLDASDYIIIHIEIPKIRNFKAERHYFKYPVPFGYRESDENMMATLSELFPISHIHTDSEILDNVAKHCNFNRNYLNLIEKIDKDKYDEDLIKILDKLPYLPFNINRFMVEYNAPTDLSQDLLNIENLLTDE